MFHPCFPHFKVHYLKSAPVIRGRAHNHPCWSLAEDLHWSSERGLLVYSDLPPEGRARWVVLIGEVPADPVHSFFTTSGVGSHLPLFYTRTERETRAPPGSWVFVGVEEGSECLAPHTLTRVTLYSVHLTGERTWVCVQRVSQGSKGLLSEMAQIIAATQYRYHRLVGGGRDAEGLWEWGRLRWGVSFTPDWWQRPLPHPWPEVSDDELSVCVS